MREKGPLLRSLSFAQQKASLPAPISKWYFPMPRSTPENAPPQVMETFRPSPRTVNACRFSAVGASKRASTPLTNHSGAGPA